MSDPWRHYAVYGTTLASTIDFPELGPSVAAPARWEFHANATLPEMDAPVELGSDRLYADVHARLYAHALGHRIVVDDTGSFDLSADRTHITCAAHVDAWPDFVRAHLLGRVLSTALFFDGLLPLHGSAVCTREGVIAFLAPKAFGKSTLALALTMAGAPLVTDDTLPVDPTAPVMAWPGVHGIRAHQDAARATGAPHSGLTTREGKEVIVGFGAAQRLDAPAPLAAIYLLEPPLADDAPATAAPVPVVDCEVVPPMFGALGILAFVKIGAMLGASASATMMERAAAIARGVPIHRLRITRDLARLPEAAASILSWHGGAL